MTSAAIREAMNEHGVTQAELAASIGMSRTQLARMLRDPEHNYTVRTLQRIAAALDTRLHVVFAGEEHDGS